MTRVELAELGLTDRELIDAFKIVAATAFDSRVTVAPLAGPDSVERQLARSSMYEQVASAWYRDPGLP